MFMSERSYERRLLSSVFRHGGKRTATYSDVTNLIHELNSSPDTISYMWSDQIEQYEGIKSIGVLWSGQID